MSFLYFIEACCETFSRQYFKNNYFFIVLDLANDNVLNIRLYLTKMLLKIRFMLNYDDPEMESLLEKFEKLLLK